jgi:nitroreductase/NAD-dependent dihydropyrimidine dehydrogenase PreA subunit
MPLFAVDPALCKRDGVCVAECPTRIIELAPDGTTPRVPVEMEEFCRNCGHCVAVCSQGAVTLATMAPGQMPPVRADWLPAPEQVEYFLRARRSIRSFTSRPVERKPLAKLIDIARFAPSASNRQPVKWMVIEDRAEVRRLAELVIDWVRAGLPTQAPVARRNNQRVLSLWESGVDMICRNAPHLIIACGPKDYPWAVTDCAIALTYLELAAPSFGLGACWGGFLTAAARQWAPLQEALALPEGQIVCGAMMVGYARYRYHRLPLRNEPPIVWHEPNR